MNNYYSFKGDGFCFEMKRSLIASSSFYALTVTFHKALNTKQVSGVTDIIMQRIISYLNDNDLIDEITMEQLFSNYKTKYQYKPGIWPRSILKFILIDAIKDEDYLLASTIKNELLYLPYGPISKHRPWDKISSLHKIR